MSKRVLVTGGAGFVGSHIVDALLQRGHETRVFDNLAEQVHPQGRPEYLAKDIEFLHGDMRDLDAVREAIRDVDVIFHMAAAVGVGQSMYEIAHYMGANTQGTANLLQAILGEGSTGKVEKLIVASSMSIYGEGKYLCANCGEVTAEPRTSAQLERNEWDPFCARCKQALMPIATDEGKPPQATSIYALSKKDQEEMCLIYGKTYGLPVVALRFFNIYGTRQALSNPYTGVAAIFASRLLNKKAPLVFEDGRQMRDFVSVHDIVEANMLAMEGAGADGRALNIGSGQPISINEVAAALGKALGVEVQAQVMGKYRAGDIRHCFADISAARAALGYEPQVGFDEGMTELVGWLREQTPEDKAEAAVAQLNSYGLTV